MFFILPVGHSSSTVRRQPWISYIIIAVNILIFFLPTQSYNNPVKALEYVEDIAEHIKTHPDLELNPALRDVLAEHFFEEVHTSKRHSQETAAKLREEGMTGGLDHLDRLTNNLLRDERSHAQDRLDQLTEKLLAISQGGIYQQWGYMPSREGHLLTLVTTMFLHGGFMHLFGNMILFFLCGPFVEDRWGRTVFTLFYLASGVLAALCHGYLTESPDMPLVGASGAIAGVMGAFLILFFHTKIKFIYVFLFVFRIFKGHFQIPSYVVLPLWFGQQYYYAMALEGASVAFWAHVGGFIFGFVIAGLMKLLSIEEQFIAPHIDRQMTFYEAPPLLEEAMQKWLDGQSQEAIEILYQILKQSPHDTNVVHTLFDIYCSLDDTEGVRKIGSRLIDIYMKQGQLDQVKDIYKQMIINNNHQVYPAPRVLFNMASAFESAQEIDNANKAFEKLALHYPNERLALKSLVKLAMFYLEVEPDYRQAFEYFVLAKHHPAVDNNVADFIAAGIVRSRRSGGPEVAEMDEADVAGIERYVDLVSG